MRWRPVRVIVAIVAFLMIGFSTAYVTSGEVRYLTRAGLEETQILTERRPITKVLRDPDLDPAVRGQLELVLDARNAASGLGLEAGTPTPSTPTSVGTRCSWCCRPRRPTASAPFTWKYPIVGRMPYKGFFDPAMARAAAQDLDARGLDTYLRPAGAFSTLGWFNDPLLSTALDRDSVELAALVLHEMAHNTLYVKSATPFNETFAQMVGYRAAEAFFLARGDSARARAGRGPLARRTGAGCVLRLPGRSARQPLCGEAGLRGAGSGPSRRGTVGEGTARGTDRGGAEDHPGRPDGGPCGQQRAAHRGAHLPDPFGVVRGVVPAKRRGHPAGGRATATRGGRCGG